MSPSQVEEVVVHVQTRHRLQMAADDAVGDERGGRGIVVAAVLDVVQRRARTARRALSPSYHSVTRA
jgi:hypothetical protein